MVEDLLIKAFKERLDNAKICVVSINGEPAGGMCMGSIRIAEKMNKQLSNRNQSVKKVKQ